MGGAVSTEKASRENRRLCLELVAGLHHRHDNIEQVTNNGECLTGPLFLRIWNKHWPLVSVSVLDYNPAC